MFLEIFLTRRELLKLSELSDNFYLYFMLWDIFTFDQQNVFKMFDDSKVVLLKSRFDFSQPLHFDSNWVNRVEDF